jgi:hypothetical protein
VTDCVLVVVLVLVLKRAFLRVRKRRGGCAVIRVKFKPGHNGVANVKGSKVREGGSHSL